MPELPDITVYVEALERHTLGQKLETVRVHSPFLLRTFDPPLDAVHGKRVRSIRRIGKRIALGLDDDLWLVLHLMIAGRLHWKPRGAKLGGKSALAAFDFENGSLLLTEAGSKHRASLYVLRGEHALIEHDSGGIEPLDASLESFAEALRQQNHTLKRALTDPHLFSGIGNAYSDEILHRARLSPLALSQKLKVDEVERLYRATRDVLVEWTERLRAEPALAFQKKSRHFARAWPCTGDSASHARIAEHRCSESATPITRRITARVAKRDGESSPTDRSRVC